MIRVVFSFFVVINVIVMLWANGAGKEVGRQHSSKRAPQIQGDDLILITEVAPSQLTARVTEEILVEEVEQNQTPDEPETEILDQCMMLAHFEFREDAEALADQIRAFGVGVELVVEKIEAPGPVMVYIKPFISAQEAQRELRVLQSSDVDSFIIADGELINGISLGVFRTEQNALAQEVLVESLGYDVETRHLMVQKDQFSLIASGEVLGALEDDYWLKIANENKDISIEQKVCNEVASEVKFQ